MSEPEFPAPEGYKWAVSYNRDYDTRTHTYGKEYSVLEIRKKYFMGLLSSRVLAYKVARVGSRDTGDRVREAARNILNDLETLNKAEEELKKYGG